MAKKGRRWMFGSLNLKTLMWIFEQRSRLREAGSRRRRPRIHRQRLAEVPRCGLRVAGVQGEETKIDIGLGIPRVGGDRRSESGPRAVAATESGARGAYKILRAAVPRVRGGDALRGRGGLVDSAALEQRGRKVVLGFEPAGEPRGQHLDDRLEPFEIACIRHNGRELFERARIVGREARGLGGRRDRRVQAAFGRQQSRHRDPDRRVGRFALRDTLQPGS